MSDLNQPENKEVKGSLCTSVLLLPRRICKQRGWAVTGSGCLHALEHGANRPAAFPKPRWPSSLLVGLWKKTATSMLSI